MTLPVTVPNVLGHYFSFASIEARVFGQLFTEFTGINWDTSLDPADVYGTKSQKLGTTRGDQNATGSLEMYLLAWDRFRGMLGAGGVGYGDVRIPAIVVQFAEVGMPVLTFTLFGVRIVKANYQNARGNDASKVALDLNIMRVLEGPGGLQRIDAPLGIF